jgi:glycosyltransferase involved in cell wall biosynthesis
VIALTEHERELLSGKEGVEAARVHGPGGGPVGASDGPSGEEMRARYGLDGAPVVLFLGRKHELKGVGEILRAASTVWERFPKARFVFVGPTEGSTEALFAACDDPRVINVPPVSDDDKSGWLRACDLFVNPSVHESLGGVFLEAWAFGKPIVGGDIPPVREISQGGRSGILVQRRDPQQIAAAITRLLAEPDAARRLGELGAERVRTRYSWDHITKLTEAAYAAAAANAE